MALCKDPRAFSCTSPNDIWHFAVPSTQTQPGHLISQPLRS